MKVKKYSNGLHDYGVFLTKIICVFMCFSRDCYYDNSTTCPRCARMTDRKQDEESDVKDA